MAEKDDISLIAEIDEAVRAERFQSLWRRVGKYVIGGSVVILALTVLGVGVREYRAGQAEKATGALIRAAEISDPAERLEALKGIDAPDAGLSALARLHRAGALQQAGRGEEASAVLAQLASDGEAPLALRHYALLLAGTPKAVDSQPFLPTARELQAAQAWKDGDARTAIMLLEMNAADPQAPASLRERGGMLAQHIRAVTPDAPAAASEAGDE